MMVENWSLAKYKKEAHSQERENIGGSRGRSLGWLKTSWEIGPSRGKDEQMKKDPKRPFWLVKVPKGGMG